MAEGATKTDLGRHRSFLSNVANVADEILKRVKHVKRARAQAGVAIVYLGIFTLVPPIDMHVICTTILRVLNVFQPPILVIISEALVVDT